MRKRLKNDNRSHPWANHREVQSRFFFQYHQARFFAVTLFVLLVMVLLMAWSEQTVAQTGYEIKNLAVSKVTSNSAYLVLKTDYPSGIKVDLATSSGAYTTSVASSSQPAGIDGYFRHEVLLEGLNASSLIYYRVTDAAGSLILVGEKSFRTARGPGEEINFGVVSDIHSDYTAGPPWYPWWRDVMAKLGAQTPFLDLVLNAGDMIHVTEWTASKGWEWVDTPGVITGEYNQLFSGTMQFTGSTPLYNAAGNHEAIGYQHGKDVYEREFALPTNQGPLADPIYREEYYSFDNGDTHFISLSTEIPDHNAGLGANNKKDESDQSNSYCCTILNPLGNYPRNANDVVYPEWSEYGNQYRWLEDDLVKAKQNGKEWIVVYLHRPLFLGNAQPCDGSPPEEIIAWGNCGLPADDPADTICLNRAKINRDEIHQLFKKYGVDVVFQGHTHRYRRHVEDGIAYITAGFGGELQAGPERDYSCSEPTATVYPPFPGDIERYAVDFLKVRGTDAVMNIKAKDHENPNDASLDSLVQRNTALSINSDATDGSGQTTGGDCSIVGVWDPINKKCTLTTDVVAGLPDGEGSPNSETAPRAISIDGNDITLDGNGHTIFGNEAAGGIGVVVDGVSGVKVQNLTVQDFWIGVSLQGASSSTYDSSTVSACTVGVSIGTGSLGNTLKNNSIANNDYGIIVANSQNNLIDNNDINNNSDSAVDFFYANSNTVRNNSIGKTWNVIHFFSSTSDGNLFYNNNCSDYQYPVANVENAGPNNSFNKPRPEGGNYWVRWTSPDALNADGNAGPDGIVDSPYQLRDAAGRLLAQDDLPWVTANGWPNTSSNLAATFVSQAVPTHIVEGAKTEASITFRNDGDSNWTLAEGFYLSSANPTGNNDWGASRVNLNEQEVIAPGALKTFTFEVTAPSQLGSSGFQWQMAQDGSPFGAASSNVDINVGPASVNHGRDNFTLTAFLDANNYYWYFTPTGQIKIDFTSAADLPLFGPTGRIPGPNQIIEVDITSSNSNGQAGFHFMRADDVEGSSKHLGVFLSPYQVTLHRMGLGDTSASYPVGGGPAFNRGTGTHHVKMVKMGQNIKVYVDEVLYIDDSNMLNTSYDAYGRVALRCINTGCSYDGLKAISIKPVAGIWYFDGEGRLATESTGTIALDGESGFIAGANQTVEMDVSSINTSGSVGFHFRRADGNDGNNYHYGVFLNATQVVLHRMNLGDTAVSLPDGGIGDPFIRGTATHRVKLVQTGQNIKIYVDDVLYIDDSNPLNLNYAAYGRIAPRCVGAGCRYDHIRVWENT